MKNFEAIILAGCLVSPASYHKYHLAILNGALNSFNLTKAKQNQVDFISDVAAGMHDEKGKIANKCLSKSIKMLAEDLDFLENE